MHLLRTCYFQFSWVIAPPQKIRIGVSPDSVQAIAEILKVSFSLCQRNLIKTFQIEDMIALITKMDLIFS